MTRQVDVAVVGAGPAGMAAATWLGERGVAVLLLDEQPALGGQIYRAVEQVVEQRRAHMRALGPDYAHGAKLVRAFQASGSEYWPLSTVWAITADRELWVSSEGRSQRIGARHIIIATGATERPVPLPGWTLPGVMTVGALQILLKTSGMVVADRLVLAGSGPLLLQYTAQCLALGVKPQALIDTGRRGALVNAIATLPQALTGYGPSYLSKGVKLLSLLRRSKVPVFHACIDVQIHGEDRVQSISFLSGGKRHDLSASMVGLHDGVIPMQHLARQAGCRHLWDPVQKCLRPTVDPWGNSSVAGVAVVGDGAGIAGARAAEHAGRIAAAEAARTLGFVSAAERDRATADDRRERRRHGSVRKLLDRLYAPILASAVPSDATLVCRCEEVTAGSIRATAAADDVNPDRLKRLLRCGMGPCQGRMCGSAVTQLITQAQRRTPDEVGYYNVRAPLKPMSLAEIAGIDTEGYEE